MGKKTDTIQDIKKLTPEKKLEAQGVLSDPVKAMRAFTKGSLFRFMIYMWDTYSNDTFVPNWHIEELCKELETVARRVAKGEKKEYDMAQATWTKEEEATGEKSGGGRTKFVIGGALMIVAIGFLVFNALRGNTQYYVTVDEYYAEQNKFAVNITNCKICAEFIYSAAKFFHLT